MEYIGKAKKFYTLWEVSSEPYVSSRGRDFIATHHRFVKNISFDFDKAVAKHPNATVDLTLCGHHSWTSYQPVKPAADVFNAGKYYKQKIADCTDYDYMHWAFDKENVIPFESRDLVESILTDHGYRRINENHIATPEEVAEIENSYEEAEEISEILETEGKIDILPMSNLTEDGNLTIEKVTYIFPNFKVNCYAGYFYGLPTNAKGQGKRIKGKMVEIIPESWEIKENEYGWGATLEVKVKDFNIIK